MDTHFQYRSDEGDLVLIEAGEKFIWSGEMTLFISCRSAFHIEQHQLVNYNEHT